MANIKLDFSQFKHKESAKDSTTLEHKKDGHIITLYHKSLSKDNQDKLKALGSSAKNAQQSSDKTEAKADVDDAKYGKIKDKTPPTDTNYGKVLDPKGEKPKVYAQGGKVQPELTWLEKVDKFADDISGEKPSYNKAPPSPNTDRMSFKQEYAEGGEITDEEPQAVTPMDPNSPEQANVMPTEATATRPTALDQALTPDINALPKEDLYKNGRINFPEGTLGAKTQEALKPGGLEGTVNDYSQPPPAWMSESEKKQFVEKQQAASEAAKPKEVPTAPTGAQTSQAQSQQAQASLSKPQADLMDPSAGILQGYNTQIAGQQLQAKALGEQGKAESAILQRQAAAQQDALQSYKSTIADLNQDLQRHEQDIKNGYIDPNKYWTGYTASNGDKVAGHSKMAAAIGMIVAGFNPTSSPNGAEQMLKYQMDQSLEGQKQNLASSHNLLRANLDHFKNINDATAMTKAMMIDAATSQLQQAAANAKTPMAQAAAMQAIGPLQIQKAQAMRQVAMSQALMKLSNGGSSNNPSNTAPAEHLLQQMYQFAPDQAKELAPRIVPGVGVAPIAVPAEIRQELTGKQQFNQMAQHYVDWVKQNGGTLNPAKINQGAALAAELQGAYRQAVKGGTYKEGEQEFIEKLIPSKPDQWAGSVRTIPKVQELINQNNAQFNVLKSSYGLPKSQPASATEPVERFDKASGQTALFDPTTKKFLGYKK